MTPALTAAFEEQARACERLDSPFMGRALPAMLEAIDPATALGQRLLKWNPETLSPMRDSVPLRLAGAFHALKRAGNPTLAAAYPPAELPAPSLVDAYRKVALEQERPILDWLDSPPQTNEVRRAACLIAAGHWLTGRLGKPLVVSEVGASAGLNLNWDFFCLDLEAQRLGPVTSPVQLSPDWRGRPPDNYPPYVAEARGVDLNPLDVRASAGKDRLLAYLWPDQDSRIARTEAAISVFNAPDTEARLDRGDALEWLPDRLVSVPGHTRFLYSTIAWQYLPQHAQSQGQHLIEMAGRAARADSPLAWFRMESDNTDNGAGLRLRLWPGNHDLDFGRIDFHGRWVDWRAPQP